MDNILIVEMYPGPQGSFVTQKSRGPAASWELWYVDTETNEGYDQHYDCYATRKEAVTWAKKLIQQGHQGVWVVYNNLPPMEY